MTNIEKIKQLAGAVDADLQEDVESVILNAGKYVAAVTTMECAAMNLQNRKGEDFRSEARILLDHGHIMRLLILSISPISWLILSAPRKSTPVDQNAATMATSPLPS